VVNRHCFFSLLSFLPDCGMNCRFSRTLSVTQYLFTLCLVKWRGMVELSVYRASHACRYVQTVAALCSVGWSLQNLWERWWVWNKVGDYTLDVGFICMCVQPAQRPVLSRKFWTPSIPGTTSMIRSLPGLDQVQQQFSKQLCGESVAYSEVLTKLSRIPSSVENTSVTT
jgi:hypothetical protein